MDEKKKKSVLRGRIKTLCYMLADALLMNLGVLAAILLSLADDASIKLSTTFLTFAVTVPTLSVLSAVILRSFGIYRIIWKYAKLKDIYKTAAAAFVASFMTYGIHMMLRSFHVIAPFRVIVYVMGSLFGTAFLILWRMIMRQRDRTGDTLRHRRAEKTEKVLVIGGGTAGAMIIKDLVYSDQRAFRICGVIDDDPEKRGQQVYGVRVLGGRHEIPAVCEKFGVDEILFCIPTVKARDRVEILNICASTGCQVKVLPGTVQLLDGRIDGSLMRKVEIEDLLERDPIVIDNSDVKDFVSGKVVLVTGGGGSIGSELCRQLAANTPRELIIFDIYENNAYAIQNELKRKYPDLPLTVLIGSVRDENRLRSVFAEHRPDVVYHAAAHKHVPLMEDSPKEAIKNNVFGTLNTVRAADEFGVKRFVLISTDKAVNPTNVMGATKRICEMIVQTWDKQSKTEFVAVRFGNVLGSNGSVVPLFKEQIAAGGPVTVTHPDIIRYFMTIPEAVSLVLQAGILAKGGEIFVLDMGKPVRILDMAEKLIRLSGYEPYTDIKIEFTGLRPGEKLYEELLMDEEGLTDTPNKLIHIGKPIPLSPDFPERLNALRSALEDEDHFDARAEIAALVPTFHPARRAD